MKGNKLVVRLMDPFESFSSYELTHYKKKRSGSGCFSVCLIVFLVVIVLVGRFSSQN
jgi:hypothetical protein